MVISDKCMQKIAYVSVNVNVYTWFSIFEDHSHQIPKDRLKFFEVRVIVRRL